MKEYNSKKWWIDGDSVPELAVEAEDLKEALGKYKEHVEQKAFIDISKTAMKEKQPMYIDTKSGDPLQIGYVITGSADFEDESSHFKKQYVDLWITIYAVEYVQF